MDENALTYALKLLRRRDYAREELRRRLESRFDTEVETILEWLEGRGYVDDPRFARTFIESRPHWGPLRIGADLEQRGISAAVRHQVISEHSWPSASDVVRDRMVRMRLRPPLGEEGAARLARSLGRLGYDPVEIAEELERLL